METLHLSYDEVLNLPYRNLIVMQRDKLRTTTGDVVREVSEEEYFKMKGVDKFKQT